MSCPIYFNIDKLVKIIDNVSKSTKINDKIKNSQNTDCKVKSNCIVDKNNKTKYTNNDDNYDPIIIDGIIDNLW